MANKDYVQSAPGKVSLLRVNNIDGLDSNPADLSRNIANAGGTADSIANHLGKALPVNTVADMKSRGTLKAGDVVRTRGYHTGGDGGQNTYIIRSGSGEDDGGSIINLPGNLHAEGQFPEGVYRLQQWGAAMDGVADDTAHVKAAVAYLLSASDQERPLNVLIDKPTVVAETIACSWSTGVETTCKGKLIAKSGFDDKSPVVRFGMSEDPAGEAHGRWRGVIPRIQVDCGNQHIIGIELGRPWVAAHIGLVEVYRSAYIGVLHSSGGYGFTLEKMVLTGADNGSAGDDSVGFMQYGTAADSVFQQADIWGFVVGVQVYGSNNSFHAFHPFGFYGESKRSEMKYCFIIDGEANTFVSCLADSPTVNGWNSTSDVRKGNRYIGCGVYVPNGDNIPDTIIGFNLVDQGTVIAPSVQSAGPEIKPFQFGGQMTVVGRSEFVVDQSTEPVFNGTTYFKRGAVMNTQYIDTEWSNSGWGDMRFETYDTKWLYINSNHNGAASNLRLPRYSYGKGADKPSDLGGSDGGYLYFNTDNSNLEFWDGSQWRTVST